MRNPERTFVVIAVIWGAVVLSLFGFGIWVVIKIMQHFGVI